MSKEQHSDEKCIFEKASVGIVAKCDDSVIGDEDGAALSGHRQEDPSNRFLLSVGPSHARDATVYMEHAISTANLAEKFDVQRPNPNATMLRTWIPNLNDVYSLRSSRADRYPVPMDAMDGSDVRHASNKRSQSVADKLSDKNDALLVHFGATRLVDCASTRNERMPLVQGRGWCAVLRLSDVVWRSRQLFRRMVFFDNLHQTAYGSQKVIVRIETCHGHRLGAGRRV